VYIDNVERARIDLYAATRQAPTAPLYTSGELSGPVHTIAIRPLGDHTGASTGNAVSIDAIGCLSPTGRVDESQLYDQDAIASHPAGTATATLSSISYQGVWGSFGGLSGRYGPTVRSANSVGVKVTVTCTQCTGLEWYGSRNASMGIANVSVDGAATTTVDQFNPTQTTSQRMFGVSGLVLGSHTLTVSVSGSKSPSARGTYLEVDAVGVF
jgi:hypothetical protein